MAKILAAVAVVVVGFLAWVMFTDASLPEVDVPAQIEADTPVLSDPDADDDALLDEVAAEALDFTGDAETAPSDNVPADDIPDGVADEVPGDAEQR